jgi:hypothetical protein
VARACWQLTWLGAVITWLDATLATYMDDDVAAYINNDVAAYVDDDVAAYMGDDVAIMTSSHIHNSEMVLIWANYFTDSLFKPTYYKTHYNS